jgi:hypothetical protein
MFWTTAMGFAKRSTDPAIGCLTGGSTTRRANHLAPARFRIVACQDPLAKIFLFFGNANHPYGFPSHPERGALANVINAGRVAVDADGAFDEGAGCGRAKACGPDIAVLVSSSR